MVCKYQTKDSLKVCSWSKRKRSNTSSTLSAFSAANIFVKIIWVTEDAIRKTITSISGGSCRTDGAFHLFNCVEGWPPRITWGASRCCSFTEGASYANNWIYRACWTFVAGRTVNTRRLTEVWLILSSLTWCTVVCRCITDRSRLTYDRIHRACWTFATLFTW